MLDGLIPGELFPSPLDGTTAVTSQVLFPEVNKKLSKLPVIEAALASQPVSDSGLNCVSVEEARPGKASISVLFEFRVTILDN
ncbi:MULTISPECIES: hypothetical protein [Comamonas]|uniref:hypothetical protein n=1 Tax=Comamonas TaxID=283 RepID=UPI001F5FD515|nr:MULTISPECIES: hypothetical protein [Comamonas]UNV89108.1 hypothetical protein MP576_15920 [Comamonas sp. 7D-2evo1]UNV97593.1 hypothetical protein MPZ60_10485 [Comamonas sp. 7D-2]UNV98750.1 hypothetical protein MP579_15890 [Comamonas sp. 7D-2evo2]